jgi:hypothetical protein
LKDTTKVGIAVGVLAFFLFITLIVPFAIG